MLTTQIPSVSSEAVGRLVDYVQKDAEADLQRAIEAQEYKILAKLGDFGQHLVYRKAAAQWDNPRWMAGGKPRRHLKDDDLESVHFDSWFARELSQLTGEVDLQGYA